MTEQTERADLARVYRAIGNSKAPMPIDVDVWPNHAGGKGEITLRFPDGDMAAVTAWAKAIGGKAVHGPTLANGAKLWHAFESDSVYGGREGEWLGWQVRVGCHVSGPSPKDNKVAPLALGTGDEPADEAIVPNGHCGESVPQAGGVS